MDYDDKNMKVSLTPNPQGALRGLAFLVLAALFIFLGVRSWREVREGGSVMPQNTITISGKGSVFAKPDIGQVSLSIVHERPTVAEAQKESTDAANKVVAFLKSKGVEDKDIKTTDYSIYPQYNYTQDRGQIFRGYEVRQSVGVKIRKLDSVSDILAGAASAGANQVSNLTFTIDDPDQIKGQARSEAIVDAKTKAQELARELGVKLGRVINFTESEGGGYPPMMYDSYGGKGGVGAAAPTPTINPGENEVVSNVVVTYEIR